MRDRLLEKLARLASERPGLVIAAAGLATLVLGGLALTMKFDASFLKLANPNKPEVVLFREAVENFGEPVNLFLVAESDDPGSVERFIDEARTRLAGIEEITGLESSAPVEFFRDNALWFLGPDETRGLLELMRAAAALRQPGAKRPVELVLEYAAANRDEFSAQAVAALTDLAHGRVPRLGHAEPWSELEALMEFEAPYATPDGRLRFLIVRTDMNPLEITLGMPAYKKILAEIEALKPDYPGVDAGFTGLYALGYEDQTGTMNRFKALSVASLILMMLIFYYFTHIRAAPLMLGVTLAAVVACTFGFVKLIYGYASLTTALFGIFLFGLGIDFAIHIMIRYTEGRNQGLDDGGALRASVIGAGPGVITGGLTTAAAFAMLVFSDFRGGEQLGVTTSIGLVLSLLAMLTLFPALIAIWHRRPVRSRPLDISARARWIDAVAGFSIRRPGIVLALCGVFTLALVPFLKNFEIHYDLDRMIYRDTPSLQYKRKLEERFDTGTEFAIAFADSVEDARRFSARLSGFDSVKRVESAADYIPEADEDRVELARLVNELAGSRPVAGGTAPQPLEESLARISSGLEPDAAPELESLLELMQSRAADPGFRAGIELFEGVLTAALERGITLMSRAAPPRPPGIDDLPEELRVRLVARDGRFPLVIFPEGNILRRQALLEFKHDIRTVRPEATGMMIMTELMTTAGMKRLPLVVSLILIAVALILYADFRNLGHTLAALLPVAAACVWTLGLLCVLRPMMTIFIALAFPLVAGIGVDDGVHLVHRARQLGGLSRIGDAVRITGRPIFMTTLTTTAGFGILLFTNHNGLIGMGAAVTLGVGLCFVASITVVPALVVLLAGRRRRDRSAHENHG